MPSGSTNNQVTYEMITNLAVPPHSEIFNTYGNLSNAQLLARYGFVLEDNGNDGVEWLEADLREFAVKELGGGGAPVEGSGPESVDRVMNLWRAILRVWGSDSAWMGSELVYHPGMQGNQEENRSMMMTGEGRDAQCGLILRLNSDAQVSYQLWIFCALLHLDTDGVEAPDRISDSDNEFGETVEMSMEEGEAREPGDRNGDRGVREIAIVRWLEEMAGVQIALEEKAESGMGELIDF